MPRLPRVFAFSDRRNRRENRRSLARHPLSPGYEVERPNQIRRERHLSVAVSDIVAPMPGQVLPDTKHLEDLLGFVHAWDRAEPMVIHCFAGCQPLDRGRLHRRLRA